MASRRAIGHWLILLLLSVLFSSLLLRIHLPAALLLGPLIAGLILSLRGVKLSIPRPCYLAAQAIVGCMIARAINPSVWRAIQQLGAGAGDPVDHHGDKRPYRLAAGPLQRAAGRHWRWGLSRRRVGNGGDGPEYGADVRLVALMQYLRVLFVVGAAALVVRYATAMKHRR